MPRFFNRIRKQLAIDNKFFQYSRYAIGEILLVVIGILIALQVDSWNEERKKEAQMVENLKELKLELESNISKAYGILRFYGNRDRLIRPHLCNTISREDIRSTSDLRRQWVLGTSSFIAPFDRTVLDKMLLELENLPQELDNFKSGLRFLDAMYEEIVQDNKEYIEMAKRERDYRAENLSWNRETWRWDRPFDTEVYSKILDYLFEDSHYQNHLFAYWYFLNGGSGLVDDLQVLREESIFWLESISNYLNQTEDISYQLPEEWRFDLSELVGTYKVTKRLGNDGEQINDMGEYILFEEDSRLVSFTRFDRELQKNYQSDQKVEWVVLDSKTVISPSGWFMYLVQMDSSNTSLEYAGCNNRSLYFTKMD